MLRLAQRPALDHLQHRRYLARPHAALRVLARVGDRGGEALDELAGDPDHDLTRDGFRHVLGSLERAVAGLDHRLQVGDGAARHGGRRLRLAADPEHLAVQAVSPYHQNLDEVGADVEHGEMPVVLTPLAQELELSHPRASPSVSSSRLKASAAGMVRVPRASCGLPPPLPSMAARRAASYSGVRSLDTLITNLSPATTVT